MWYVIQGTAWTSIIIPGLMTSCGDNVDNWRQGKTAKGRLKRPTGPWGAKHRMHYKEKLKVLQWWTNANSRIALNQGDYWSWRGEVVELCEANKGTNFIPVL